MQERPSFVGFGTPGTGVRDVMTGGTQCVDENDNLMEAAKKLAQLKVEALPICGKDGQLKA